MDGLVLVRPKDGGVFFEGGWFFGWFVGCGSKTGGCWLWMIIGAQLGWKGLLGCFRPGNLREKPGGHQDLQ